MKVDSFHKAWLLLLEHPLPLLPKLPLELLEELPWLLWFPKEPPPPLLKLPLLAISVVLQETV